ncbi:zinc-binding dehydrogenase [Nocardia sp. NPDC056100]|uniref:zinc-binding dehydrogenase n=1 Tax=Nocardia sp. NPDC056100 TaxID=3345712 RepID=UPI0035D8EC84
MDTLPTGLTRAAVWDGTGVDIRTIPIPELRTGECLVRVRLATVCGSDLHTISGRRPGPYPSILGHEAVGEVIAIGANAPAAVGDRIVWSVTVACGHCARCRSGRTAKCVAVRKIGHEAMHPDWELSGSYAQHIVLPAGTTVVQVPNGMPDQVAAPAACATATVMATLEAAGELAGRRVLICGAGMLGITAAAACHEAGATVHITDIDPDRLHLAEHFGARPDNGSKADIAFDFSGSTDAVREAYSRLDIGGTLVLAGSVKPGPPLPLDPEAVVRQWLTLTGVHNYEPRHLTRAIALLDRTRTRYPWHTLIAPPVPLDKITTALGPTPPGILRSAITP